MMMNGLDSFQSIFNEWRKQTIIANGDNHTITTLNQRLNNYIQNSILIENINKSFKVKKIRNENFPSDISENLCKFSIIDKEFKNIKWDIKLGDLSYNNDKIEVKAFSSTGPISFGPTEKWTELYIIDALKYKEKKFKIYKINLSNDNEIIQNIKKIQIIIT